METRELIVARNVVRRYRRPRHSLIRPAESVEALRGVDLDVHSAQRLGIVGESGSGKEITTTSERSLKFLRRELQIIFQDPVGSLDPRMKVRDIIIEPLVALGHANPRARVAELLHAVGLPTTAAERYPHEFSGGQRQRISIARALSPQPKVLVADEPVSSLDVSVRAQILNLLMDLADEFALTLVFVSHDLAVVRRLCDSVVVLHHGEIVERGAIATVYEHPQHPYTQRLLAAVPTLAKALAAHRAHHPIQRSSASDRLDGR